MDEVVEKRIADLEEKLRWQVIHYDTLRRMYNRYFRYADKEIQTLRSECFKLRESL